MEGTGDMGRPGPKIRSLGVVCKLFWERVRKSPGCWTWAGSRKSPMGYGAVWCRPRLWSAHRLAWVSENGHIPKGMMVLHRCDNPICVRPSHLYLGNHVDNMNDRQRRGRTNKKGLPGEQNGRAKITEKDVVEIRASTAPRAVLVEKYGLTKCTISQIVRRQSWRHVA